MDGFGKFQEHEKLEFLLTFTSCSCYLIRTAYAVILYNYFTECCRAIQEEWGRAGICALSALPLACRVLWV